MQTQQAAPTRSVAVELDAREAGQVAAGVTMPGYGLQRADPGPTIEASVGDTPAGKPDPHRQDARRRAGQLDDHCHILEHHAAGMMAHFDLIR